MACDAPSQRQVIQTFIREESKMATTLARRRLLDLENNVFRACLSRLSNSSSQKLHNRISALATNSIQSRNVGTDHSGKGSFFSKLLGPTFAPHTDAHSKTLTESLTIYEIQFHYVKPECMDEYISLVAEQLPKMDQSKGFCGTLIGSWKNQFGVLDQCVHLWGYKGGWKGVTEAKKFLANDKEFSIFAKKRSSLLHQRENQLLHEFSFWEEPQFREPSHIYELRSYSLKPGTLIEWGNNWGNAIKIRQKDAVGGFFSQMGDLYEVHHIWAYKDLHHRKTAREEMWQEPGWCDCVANTVPLVNSMRSRLLIPTSFSPMQ